MSKLSDGVDQHGRRIPFDSSPEAQPQGEELLPCPWCGTQPEVCKAAGYGFTVECVNERCPVAPALNVTRGRQNAINAWEARADLPRATADDGSLFKNACRLHTAWTIDRYLMSNAVNRLDPAEKAERHIELCKFYVAAVRGCSPEDAMSDYERDFDRLHEESQGLTSSLDTAIGFPLGQIPDYNDLNPKFFERFHAIACRVLGVSATPRATGETTVEAALTELREMFPDASFLSVKEHSIYQPSMGHWPNQAEVQIEDKGFRRVSLADCMAQVRAAAQSKTERGKK